jgi:hypothetical protein
MTRDFGDFGRVSDFVVPSLSGSDNVRECKIKVWL